tara:strand:- start:2435 stop:2956 length:522 start_codon:yes stop_codon:yes gene_type:complete
LDNTLLKNIAARLKIARIESGFKKSKDFAKEMGLPANTYSQHETLKRSLSLQNLLSYSSVLGVDPGWLLTGRGSPIEKPSLDVFKEKRIFDRVRELESKGLIVSPKAAIIEEDKKISFVDRKLLKKVLLNIVPILKDNQEYKTNEEIIDFCFQIYNAIAMSNIDHPACANLLL